MIQLRHILCVTGFAFCVTIAFATRFPELGDEPSFKVWATQAVVDGISQAYRSRAFGYDWLPLYLYVSKAAGLVYTQTGLAEIFGTYHHALTMLLKLFMTGFHLLTVALVYRICRVLEMGERTVAIVTIGVGLSPGTLLATAAFGYQDAFHTLIVAAALYAALHKRLVFCCVLAAAAALTKPQAAIYLGPFWLLMLMERSPRLVLKCLLVSFLAAVAILSPFILNGTLDDVWSMYAYVPRIHQWLTGCAHNVWWLVAPVPPFRSDRVALLAGLNGLWIGLITFVGFCILTAVRIVQQGGVRSIPSSAAFMAFAFFMVVTQIHENHLYACFVFLGIAAGLEPRLWPVFGALSLTFAADLVLTLYLLNANVPIMLGPIRLSIVNAWINLGVLVWWTWLVIRDLGFAGRPARRWSGVEGARTGESLIAGGDPGKSEQSSVS